MFNLLAQDFSSYIMIIVLLVAIVGLFAWSSRSNKKRQQQAQDMVNNLKVGDRVKTIGGVCGFVAEINNAENTFVLRTGMEGKESYVKFDKGAIYQTAPGEVKAEPKAEVKAEPKKTTKKAPAKEEVESAPVVEEKTDAE